MNSFCHRDDWTRHPDSDLWRFRVGVATCRHMDSRGRTGLAYASGLIMLRGGVGLLLRATTAWSVRVLFPYESYGPC
jgi:hypothetical protein